MNNEAVTEEVIFAVVAGQPLKQLPPNLFIPPDALEILLDSFTGPLDILLYLIKEQSLDIMDIPIATITLQYMHYIELLEGARRELAAEYLVMAAWLIEIKSKLLLPVPSLPEAQEEDPRLVLVRRLQAYERFKRAAQYLDALPRLDRDYFMVAVTPPPRDTTTPQPEVALSALVAAMKRLLHREGLVLRHQVTRERLSVQQRLTEVLSRLQGEEVLELTTLLKAAEGRMGLVVTFLALLELERQALVKLSQTMAFARLYLCAS